MAAWCDEAGQHCERVHEALVQQQAIDGGVVGVDELRVKLHGQIVWLAMGLLVGPQLWLGAALAPARDKHLLRALAGLVKAALLIGGALAVIFDGLPEMAPPFTLTPVLPPEDTTVYFARLTSQAAPSTLQVIALGAGTASLTAPPPPPPLSDRANICHHRSSGV